MSKILGVIIGLALIAFPVGLFAATGALICGTELDAEFTDDGWPVIEDGRGCRRARS